MARELQEARPLTTGACKQQQRTIVQVYETRKRLETRKALLIKMLETLLNNRRDLSSLVLSFSSALLIHVNSLSKRMMYTVLPLVKHTRLILDCRQ